MKPEALYQAKLYRQLYFQAEPSYFFRFKTESVKFDTNQKVKFNVDNEYAVEIRVLKIKSDGSKLVNVELVRTAAVDIKSKEDDSVELHLPNGRFVNSDRLVIENNQAISITLNKCPALIEITKLVDVIETK